MSTTIASGTAGSGAAPGREQAAAAKAGHLLADAQTTPGTLAADEASAEMTEAGQSGRAGAPRLMA